MKHETKRFIMLSPLMIAGVVLFAILGGYIVQRLWNWLLPPLFGWHELTLWQGLGMLALCRILFGGLGRHGGDHFRRRRLEKENAMSPEERERFRQGIGQRFGFSAPTSEGKPE